MKTLNVICAFQSVHSLMALLLVNLLVVYSLKRVCVPALFHNMHKDLTLQSFTEVNATTHLPMLLIVPRVFTTTLQKRCLKEQINILLVSVSTTLCISEKISSSNGKVNFC